MKRLLGAALLALASVRDGCDGCRRPPELEQPAQPDSAPAADAAPSVSVDAAPLPPPSKTRKGGLDVTFTAVSDTHFGFGGIPELHAVLIPALNSIAGKEYPRLIGGEVAPPRGLIITGDLTEWGKPEEWPLFVSTYAKVKYPVYEVEGNHDKVSSHFVEEQVAKRHGGAGHFYSYDWDDLHMVALGEAPDEAGLAFLESDLVKVARDVPVILYFHRALEGPWSDDNWFNDALKTRLASYATRWNVIAIFHGHHHATDHYTWHGIDVIKPGAVKGDAHTFAVVHVTDDHLSVAEWNWDDGTGSVGGHWASSFERELTPRTP